MTTKREVKRLLKPILGESDDLLLFDRQLIITPVRHLVRGVLIDRRRSAVDFRPVSFCVHLFELRTWLPLSWGLHMFPRKPVSWSFMDTGMPDELHRVIRSEVLPVLRGIDTLEKFVTWVSGHHQRHHLFDQPAVKVIVDVAMGNLDAARELCRTKIEPRDEATYGRDNDDKAELRRLKELCHRLARDDRAGLAALLHEWEAATVKNLKLEKYWQPTPFPLELQAG